MPIRSHIVSVMVHLPEELSSLGCTKDGGRLQHTSLLGSFTCTVMSTSGSKMCHEIISGGNSGQRKQCRLTNFSVWGCAERWERKRTWKKWVLFMVSCQRKGRKGIKTNELGSTFLDGRVGRTHKRQSHEKRCTLSFSSHEWLRTQRWPTNWINSFFFSLTCKKLWYLYTSCLWKLVQLNLSPILICGFNSFFSIIITTISEGSIRSKCPNLVRKGSPMEPYENI